MDTRPSTPDSDGSADDRGRAARIEHGMSVLDEIVKGDGHEVVESLQDIAPEMAFAVIGHGFSDVYSRPQLRPEQRQLVTIGVLTAMGGCERQLKVHVGAALNVGLTTTEIVESMLHASVYCGLPRALNAVFAAKEVFAERDLLPVVS
jgi:4-carboxymuconolactone decarboxylase